MIVRNAESGDSKSLADLATALGQDVGVDQFAQDIARYDQGFHLAEIGGVVAGYLVMRTAETPECVQGNSPIQLWRLFVSAEHQGKGVAADLLSRAVDHARAGRHDLVWLGTSEDNARAIAFYRKHGFHSAGVARLHHGHGSHQDLIMRRPME